MEAVEMMDVVTLMVVVPTMHDDGSKEQWSFYTVTSHIL
jgi:hypothetical protein